MSSESSVPPKEPSYRIPVSLTSYSTFKSMMVGKVYSHASDLYVYFIRRNSGSSTVSL